MQIFALPLHRQDEVVGGLAVVHDATYIRAQSLRVWRAALLRVLIHFAGLLLITLLIMHSTMHFFFFFFVCGFTWSVAYAPTHDQQRNKNNQENLDEDPQESGAPDAKALGADVSGIVHYRQPTHNFILAMQRQRKNLHGTLAYADERALAMTLCHGCDHFRWRRRHDLSQLRSDRHDMALAIVYGDAHQMFAIAEPLNQPLQSPLRSRLPGSFHIARDALAENLRAPFQIASQRALFTHDLVIRETERHQCDADNKRDDKPDTQQAHRDCFPMDIRSSLVREALREHTGITLAFREKPQCGKLSKMQICRLIEGVISNWAQQLTISRRTSGSPRFLLFTGP